MATKEKPTQNRGGEGGRISINEGYSPVKAPTTPRPPSGAGSGAR